MTAHGDGDRYLADTGPPTAYPKSQTPPIIALDNKTLIRVGRSSLAAGRLKAGITCPRDSFVPASAGKAARNDRREMPKMLPMARVTPPLILGVTRGM